MSQQKYQSLVTKENIDYSLSKLKEEDEKKDFMNVISKVDIKIDTKPVIEGNETCYNILIRERNTKRRKHFQICTLEFRKGKKDRSFRIAAFVIMSYVNNILVVVIASKFFGSEIAALAAFYNLSYYSMIIPMKKIFYLKNERKDS